MMNYSKKDIEALAQLRAAQSNNNFVNIDGFIYRAHVLRSQYMAEMISSFFANTVGRFMKTRELAAAKSSLYAMSDHELNDLGISRAEIDAAVEGTSVEAKEAKPSFLLGTLKAFAEKFVQAQKARADYALLMSMSSRELADIGLTHGDIKAAVAEGNAPFSNDNRMPASNNNEQRQVG